MSEQPWPERRIAVAETEGRNPGLLCDGKYWSLVDCFYLRGGNCDCGKPAKPTLEGLDERIATLEARPNVGHGCVCPAGAERTCRGALCPRKPITF